MMGNHTCYFVICQLFTKINSLNIIYRHTISVSQTVWNKIRPNLLSGLILVQFVYKGYQQMTKVTDSCERIQIVFIYYLLVFTFFKFINRLRKNLNCVYLLFVSLYMF